MKLVSGICAKCGAEIPADAPEGGCPGCLLESGLRSLEEEVQTPNSDKSRAGAQRPTPNAQLRGNERASKSALLSGELGDYELLEEVGRGGQGVVFRARQKSLDRTVALKVISLGQWASEAHLKRFRREAHAAASLDHPSIVPIYEVGERDGSCYFSMKFVEGGQLDEVVKHVPMSTRQAAELIAKVAQTVHYAHEHGILHRDIKPGNILLDKNGEPHLTDFGLARLLDTQSSVTRTIDVLGTPSYMAPEQAAGETAKLSKATDVYGLGAVLYQLLTGQPPFAGGTTYETIRLLRETEPRPPRSLNHKIDRELSTICLKCLEKEPKRRYSSALALAEDLEHWLKHEPIQARRTGVVRRGTKWVRRNPTSALLAASVITLTAAIGWNVWKSELFRAAPEKSIAVLPFLNLSLDPDNPHFADAVQDEVLTNLARIADLKVISRTSTMQYKGDVARNLRKIGHELGVANVVEGSVERAGDRVRVRAQLIDARTDRHLWAQTYDRELADMFAIQRELAQKIANELRVKLSPSEKAQFERRPTQNSEAYLAFVQGHEIFYRSDKLRSNAEKAEQLFEKATKLDPNFAGAFAALALVHDWNYHDFDPAAMRKAKAQAAAIEALRLQPNLPEAHLAMGFYYYYCQRDYQAALDEFAIAKQGLPNSADVYLAIGAIERRQGKWQEATANLEKAASLTPKYAWVLLNLAETYADTRNFEAANRISDRAIEAAPQSVLSRVNKARQVIAWKGDLSVLEEELMQMPPGVDPDGIVTAERMTLFLFQRKFSEALAVLQQSPQFYYEKPRELFEGAIYAFLNEKEKARSAFNRARSIVEEALRESPDDASRHATLGLIFAGLGEKEAAIAEGKHAVELLPESQDAVDGPQMTVALAQIYTWTGQSDQALQLLKRSLRTPSGITVPLLKLDPVWDPLRSNPRFQKLCEEKIDKSIAVLPFENLSEEKANAYFAEGVQDEILTRLSKIADLKVISRTSTRRYQPKPGNLEEIAKQLGVAHVLEGSVQRVANRVRVNAQLIDARNDVPLWAQTYDRDLADVFAIQSEIAKTIADQLQAKLSPSEKTEIEERPTQDLHAFDLYIQAKAVIDSYLNATDVRATLLQALKSLDEAIRRDPNFVSAYCYAGRANDLLFFLDLDPTPDRILLADGAVNAALRLRPDSAEAHFARADYFFRCLRDYDHAQEELAIARPGLPNSTPFFILSGYINRRRNHFSEAERDFSTAFALDPWNPNAYNLLADTYVLERRFPEAAHIYDNVLVAGADIPIVRLRRATSSLYGAADTRALRDILTKFPDMEFGGGQTPLRVWMAMLDGNFPEAERVLAASPRQDFQDVDYSFYFPKSWYQAMIARAKGDSARATAAFRECREILAQRLNVKPEHARTIAVLAQVDAGLGQKDLAMQEAQHAIELTPISKDIYDGALVLEGLAQVYTWTGEHDRAIELLQKLLTMPGYINYGRLKLYPLWSPLRGNPRFEEIVASLAPKGK